jgi:hypothetical protein
MTPSDEPASIHDVYAAINREARAMGQEQAAVEAARRGSRLNHLVRAVARYYRAKDASKKYGFIGVGCITFAEHRLAVFRRRTGLILQLEDQQ